MQKEQSPSRPTRDGKSLSGSFSLFGYSLFYVWYWVFFNTNRIFPLASADTPSFGILRSIGLLSAVIALLALSLSTTRGTLNSSNDVKLALTTSSGGIASVLLTVLGRNPQDGADLIVCGFGWVAWGACAALLTYMWVKIYCAIGKRELCLHLPGSLVIGACVAYILCYLPDVTAIILAALIPFVSAGLFLRARLNIDYEGNLAYENEACAKSQRLIQKPLVKLLLAIFIYTFVYCTLIAPLGSRRGMGFEATDGLLLVAPIAAGAIFVAIALFSKEMEHLERVYKLVLPIMVAALVAFPFVTDASLTVAGLLAMFGYYCFDLITWFVVLEAAERWSAPSLRGFITARLASLAGVFAGSILSSMFIVQEWFSDKTVFTPVCLGAVVILVTATVMLLQGSKLFHQEGGEPVLLRKETPTEETLQVPDPFPEKAKRLAERYSLTPRETEVFELLARGRSNRYIEDQLNISKHTVDSHVMHIFRKCGVTSRQQVIDLFDEES